MLVYRENIILNIAIEDGVFSAAIEVGLRCKLVLNWLCLAKDVDKD